MKSLFSGRNALWLLALLAVGASSKILPSKALPTKSLKFEAKKQKVNDIMLKALTGVLAKKALSGALSQKGKARLTQTSGRERVLRDVSSRVPAKNHRSGEGEHSNYWAKAKKNFHRTSRR